MGMGQPDCARPILGAPSSRQDELFTGRSISSNEPMHALAHRLVCLAFLPALPAFAASDDAWAEFAAEVKQSCLQATSGILENGRAIVAPFGSERYGLAIVSGEVGQGQAAAIVCVFDKQTKAVQVAGELDFAIEPNS